jgi:hypothetical protein
MRRTIQSVALMLALSIPGYAGIMQCPIVEPTPQPASAVQEQPTASDISTPQTTDGDMQNDAAATFAQIVLNLFALS